MPTTPKKPEPPDIPTQIAMAAARTARRAPDRMIDHINGVVASVSDAANIAHKALLKNNEKNTKNRLSKAVVDIDISTKKRRNLVDVMPMLRRSTGRLNTPSSSKKLKESVDDPLAYLEGAPIIFGGAMSPPGLHHAAAFEYVSEIAESLGSEAFVGTTYTTGKDLRSALTTEQKIEAWVRLHGVSEENIIPMVNAYDLASVHEDLGYDGPVIFAVGAKDISRIASSRYEQIDENLYRSRTSPNAHMMVIPNIINENGITSNATSFRKRLLESKTDDEKWDTLRQYFGESVNHPENRDFLVGILEAYGKATKAVVAEAPLETDPLVDDDFHVRSIEAGMVHLKSQPKYTNTDPKQLLDFAIKMHRARHNIARYPAEKAAAPVISMGTAASIVGAALDQPAAAIGGAVAVAAGIGSVAVGHVRDARLRSFNRGVAKVHRKMGLTLSEDMIQEDKRSSQSAGERLERSMKMKSGATRTGTHAKPVMTNTLMRKKAKRSARYALRKKIAPNYTSLSTGQKADIDNQIANHPQLNAMTDQFFDRYKKKAGETKKKRVKH